MKPFFKIGLAEDDIQFRQTFESVFIHIDAKATVDEKAEIAKKYFHFIKFTTTGAAKNYMNTEKQKPDFFVVDVDFTDLNQQDIEKDNNEYNLQLRLDNEQKNLIGYEFWGHLRKEYPTMESMMLTGKYTNKNKPQIGEKIDSERLIKGNDYEIKYDKATSFSRNLKYVFQRIAAKIIKKEFLNGNPIHIKEWEDFINKSNTKGFLEAQITFTQRITPYNKCNIETLMIGWGKWGKLDGEIQLVFDDSVKNTFLSLIKSTGASTGEIIIFKGLWTESFMQKALKSYQNMDKYLDDLDNINMLSKELFEEFYTETIESNLRYRRASPIFQKQPDCSQFNKTKIDITQNMDFKNTFEFAIIHRRFLIAVSYLEQITSTNGFIVQAVQYLNISTTKSNLTNYITTDLGLSSTGIKSSSGAPIKILINSVREGCPIMIQESDFLDHFIKPFFKSKPLPI